MFRLAWSPVNSDAINIDKFLWVIKSGVLYSVKNCGMFER